MNKKFAHVFSIDDIVEVSPKGTPLMSRLQQGFSSGVTGISRASSTHQWQTFSEFGNWEEVEPIIDKTCPELKRLLEHRREKK
jgi:hypothetical protein